MKTICSSIFFVLALCILPLSAQVDSHTLGFFSLHGYDSTATKRANQVSLLTEYNVASGLGVDDSVHAAYELDHGDSWLATNLSSELDGLDSLTVEGWVKFDNSGNNVVCGRWAQFATASQFILEWQPNGKIYAFVAASSTDGGSNYAYSSTITRGSGWHYMAIVFAGGGSTNADRLKVYLDGSFVSLTYVGTIPSSLTTLSASDSLVLGAYESPSITTSSLGGSLGAFRASNVARTETELDAAYGDGGFIWPDLNTLGLWSMHGHLGTATKRANQVNLLTEYNVASGLGVDDSVHSAYSFTHEESWIATPLAAKLDGLDSLTVEGWVKFEDGTNNVLWGRWSQNFSANQFILEWQSDGGPIYAYVAASSTDVGNQRGYSGNISRGSGWHYMAIVFAGGGSTNADRLKVYLDGSFVSLSYAGTIPSSLTTLGASDSLVLGAYESPSTTTSSLGGRLASVRVSDIARTEAELDAAYTTVLSKSVFDGGVDDALPTAFYLEQNYPNPFNPTTSISYAVPVAGDVVLSVYDVLGREVSVLVREHQDQGRYVVHWNAQDQAAGIYWYRLTMGEYTQTRKMIYLK